MSIFRGWIGEKMTSFNLWLSLSKKTYQRFHDLIIPSRNGTTQIDHLIISVYGIFIVETKNKKGWIFGSETQRDWTQVIFKNKYTFQNPLRQTYRQKKVLAEFLKVDESTINTVVYFVGDCKFKTPMPSNVLKSGLGRYIRSHQIHVMPIEEVDRITTILKRHSSESSISKRDHLRSLRRRHTSNTICPRCGSDLVERVVRKGPNAGSSFIGCSAYPKCRFTKN